VIGFDIGLLNHTALK